MKTIIAIFLFGVAANAQMTLYPFGTPALNTSGSAYIKDLDGVLDKYVGTWALESAEINFTLTLQKRQMYYQQIFNVYRDLIVGEVYYKENGVVIQNTLNQLNPNQDALAHSLWGYGLTPPENFPICNDCQEARLELVYKDPERPWVDAFMILYHETTSAGETLRVTVYQHASQFPEDGQPTIIRIPSGTYILTKTQ